jgi:DNA-binding MarR family transcriptional regulator
MVDPAHEEHQPHQEHNVAACARAWQTLRLAHDRVASRLGAALAAEGGLALNEFDVLLYLRLHADEAVRLGALLEAVALSQPALSRLVARLEGRGLVARAGAADDRRATVVGLTDPGRALIDRALAVHARVVDETLIGRFTEAERAQLLATLSRIGRIGK